MNGNTFDMGPASQSHNHYHHGSDSHKTPMSTTPPYTGIQTTKVPARLTKLSISSANSSTTQKHVIFTKTCKTKRRLVTLTGSTSFVTHAYHTNGPTTSNPPVARFYPPTFTATRSDTDWDANSYQKPPLVTVAGSFWTYAAPTQDAALNRIATGITDIGIQQASLGLNIGGLGLRRTRDTAIPAELAAKLTARPEVNEICAALTTAGLMPQNHLTFPDYPSMHLHYTIS